VQDNRTSAPRALALIVEAKEEYKTLSKEGKKQLTLIAKKSPIMKLNVLRQLSATGVAKSVLWFQLVLLTIRCRLLWIDVRLKLSRVHRPHLQLHLVLELVSWRSAVRSLCRMICGLSIVVRPHTLLTLSQ
jgi:hypothetical protein